MNTDSSRRSQFGVLRALVLISAGAIVFGQWILPHLVAPTAFQQSLLDYAGAGGVLNLYGIVPTILSIFILVSLVGVWFFRPWAKTAFGTANALCLAGSLLFGMGVSLPIHGFVAFVTIFTNGAICALIFLTSAWGVRNDA